MVKHLQAVSSLYASICNDSPSSLEQNVEYILFNVIPRNGSVQEILPHVSYINITDSEIIRNRNRSQIESVLAEEVKVLQCVKLFFGRCPSSEL
jgi:hypothetical protein